ncbi:MAG: 4-hydroxybutyrate CoA-transferase [Firmicutes bacterium HGW-Firmicutes-12]|nr:MAG: 4-hydroxybutyrate CoA-transferase [Firmicutes bacterium HGW-Firmicutes-12]
MRKWLEYFKEKTISADEAVKVVKSGDRLANGHGCAQPRLLPKALLKRASELCNVEITHGFGMGLAEYCKPEYEGIFIHNSFFNNTHTRKSQWEGRGEFTPMFFFEMERAFREKVKIDVFFTQVTPPNEKGFVSTGICVDYTRGLIDNAKIVIAEVNPNMPWTYGDSIVHISEIDYFVESNEPLDELTGSEETSDIEKNIAENVASLVNDGDTLQMGIGAIPDTVLSLLKNHKDIGIHTELASNGIMKAIEAGVITNKRKSLNPDKVICTLLGGTKEFYEYVDNNPTFETRRVEYVNDPRVIAQNNNMCAINSAIQVDLFGQVVADMLNGKQFSGVGGQVDFLRGAAMSKGGKSIITLPSTAKQGSTSRITCSLDPGTCVTDTRYDVHYIVTEYGIADLWGKTDKGRTKALINIAHPKFRESLEEEFFYKTIN